MLNIHQDKIFTLYEYVNLREELSFKDILSNMVYDINHKLGVSISLDKIILYLNESLLKKYLDYLKVSLDPIYNNINVDDTKEVYMAYGGRYTMNIPDEYRDTSHSDTLDIFLDSLLEIDEVAKEYTFMIY
jgi:hypothetical protein